MYYFYFYLQQYLNKAYFFFFFYSWVEVVEVCNLACGCSREAFSLTEIMREEEEPQRLQPEARAVVTKCWQNPKFRVKAAVFHSGWMTNTRWVSRCSHKPVVSFYANLRWTQLSASSVLPNSIKNISVLRWLARHSVSNFNFRHLTGLCDSAAVE